MSLDFSLNSCLTIFRCWKHLIGGDTIFVITIREQPQAAMKPIIENLGMDWAGQFTKLRSNENRWGIEIISIPSAGGEQKTVCMPVRKLPAYLASINPNKVREELRDKIELYQNESDEALWNYIAKYSQLPQSKMSEAVAYLVNMEIPLVCHRQGQRVLSYKTSWNQACKKADVSMRMYDIRHIAASEMLAQGADLAAVAAQLGHTSVAITGNLYAHITQGSQQKAAALMPSLESDTGDTKVIRKTKK